MDEIEASYDEGTETHRYYEPMTDDSGVRALFGRCVLTIRFENGAEYAKWKKYNPGRQWEFMVSFPALMRADYEFHTTLDVEMMAKKIVQLLEMGFNVYSADWQLKPCKSQLH